MPASRQPKNEKRRVADLFGNDLSVITDNGMSEFTSESYHDAFPRVTKWVVAR